jgi:hypothetical protein
MKSVYIVGDSHAGRMANIAFDAVQAAKGVNYKYSTCSSNYYDRVLDHIDGGGNEVFHGMMSNLFYIKNDDIKLTIASTPGRSALNFDYNFYEYMNYWDSDESIVMPWLGYIDIKNWLPQKNLKNYKSVEQVVDIYVEKTINKFQKSKIIFINPMPQFEVIISARWANFSSDPAIEFEDRHSMHLDFVDALNKKTESLGMQKPIDISGIIGSPWVYTSMQFKKPIKDLYNDHLRPEFYTNILKDILINI